MRPGPTPTGRRSRTPLRLGLAIAFVALIAVAMPMVPASSAPLSASQGRAPEFTPGAPGAGDPYFPLEGNGGFDVLHYDLRLSYLPGIHRLSGSDTITAMATQSLSRFDLDLSGMRVGSVAVNGRSVRFTRQGPELVITPAVGLPAGRRFVVRLTYAGSPKTIIGSPFASGGPYGWVYTRDGAFVACDPNAARTWFPSSDHPSDKASFRFAVSVPRGIQVVANGDRVRTTPDGLLHTFVWRETEPMATYLATLAIGHWQIHPQPTPNGLPQLVAVDPALADEAAAAHVVALTGRITDYWASVFGPYPFSSTGGIVDQVNRVNLSLETQTRPLYAFAPYPSLMAHELAHQWFGDSVSVWRWRNIWLNEGIATFSNWLWTEHAGGKTTWQSGRFFYRLNRPSEPVWHVPVADPGRESIFSSAVYIRGGLTLVRLRHRLGDETFFRLLRTWVAQHRYGNGTTHEFTTLASRISGRDLGPFFQTWLWTLGKPPAPGW